jgi:hypothetical protein
VQITRDGNMASVRTGKLWLAATGRRPIDDDTWRQYLGQAAASVKSEGPFYGVLFWTPKHGPSASQRRMLTHEFAEAIALDAQRRVALISNSALVRGTITAIAWFTRDDVVTFSPNEAKRALDWLAEDITFDRAQAQHALAEIIGAVQGPIEPGAHLLNATVPMAPGRTTVGTKSHSG